MIARDQRSEIYTAERKSGDFHCSSAAIRDAPWSGDGLTRWFEIGDLVCKKFDQIRVGAHLGSNGRNGFSLSFSRTLVRVLRE